MTTVVFCSTQEKAALELLHKARTFSARVIALVEEPFDSPMPLFDAGADEVVRLPSTCEDFCAQGTRIAEALRQLQPDAALFPANVRGRFLSAWAAARLDTGLSADCTELSVTAEGWLLQSRPAFGGNLIADILCTEKRPQMASVRPGVFPMPSSCYASPKEMRTIAIEAPVQRLHCVSRTPLPNTTSIREAEVIVAGGKGIGSKAGFDKLRTLAELLHGTVGASRSAVDAGWASYAHQVGQTGSTVRPTLYIALGISGMVQHISGVSGAKTIIAVNKDRNAPIFNYADYGVVDDWERVVDAMIRHLHNQKPCTIKKEDSS